MYMYVIEIQYKKNTAIPTELHVCSVPSVTSFQHAYNFLMDITNITWSRETCMPDGNMI